MAKRLEKCRAIIPALKLESFFFLAPLLSQLHSEIPSGKKLDGGRLPNVITTLLLYVFFVSSDSSSQLERDKKEKMKYSKPFIFARLSLLKLLLRRPVAFALPIPFCIIPGTLVYQAVFWSICYVAFASYVYTEL